MSFQITFSYEEEEDEGLGDMLQLWLDNLEAIRPQWNNKWEPNFQWPPLFVFLNKEFNYGHRKLLTTHQNSETQIFWNNILLILLCKRFMFLSFCFLKVSFSGNPKLHFHLTWMGCGKLGDSLLMGDVMVSGIYMDGVSDPKLSKAHVVF